jgi:hypothetical protein
MRITAVILTVLMSTESMAAMTTTVTGLSPTRSMTGRPADLDPRIPWLEDLGMAQSGGPEPLVQTLSLPLPRKGWLSSFVAIGDRFVFMIEGKGNHLVVVDREGKVQWSRTLTDNVRWKLLANSNYIYTVPVEIDSTAKTQINISVIGYESTGVLIGQWAWPLGKGFPEAVQACRLERGVIVGQIVKGGRIHVRVDSNSKVDPDDIATVKDVGINYGKTKEERKRWKDLRKEGKLLLGVNERHSGIGSGVNAKREGRASKWKDMTLNMKGLPEFDKESGVVASESRYLSAWQGDVKWIGEDGSILMRMEIFNPHRLPRRIITDWESTAEKSRAMFAFFNRAGQLRYYIISSGEIENIFPVEDALCFCEGNKLICWIPLRRDGK